MSHDLTDLSGPAIHTYTRAQAVKDGTLREVPADMARGAGFRYPLALTVAAWADAVAWDDADCHAALPGHTERLYNVLVAAHHALVSSPPWEDRHAFNVVRVPHPLRDLVARPTTLHVHIGPGDNAEPVLTILMPDED